MVNGLGSACEVALTVLVFVPVPVAPFPAQPAASRARPAATAAAPRRAVIRSMVPPLLPKVAMDAKPPRRPSASGLPAGRDCGQHGNNATPLVSQSGHATRGAGRSATGG